MRILIYGAGAIGQWLAAELERAGCRCALIAREHHCQAIRENGIQVAGRPEVARPECHANLTALPDPTFDWVVLTVKAFQVASAVTALSAIETSGILTFQNGVGSDELVAEAFPEARIAVGTTTRAMAIPRPGHLEPAPRGGIGVAPLRGSVDELEERLRETGQVVTRLEDYRVLKWSKLLLNMVCNASCAILDMLPAQVVADRGLYRLELAAVREALRAMDRLGIRPVDLPDYPVWLFSRAVKLLPEAVSQKILGGKIARARGDKPPSLLIDLRAGRPDSEVGFLNGGVWREAEKLGLETPVNRAFTRTLTAIVAEPPLWDEYRHRPDRLFEEVTRHA